MPPLTCCRTVSVTPPEFLGPFYIALESFSAYYFTCRLAVGSDSDTDVSYEVALFFDGKLDQSLPFKTTTAMDPDVKFTPADFMGHFGEEVNKLVFM